MSFHFVQNYCRKDRSEINVIIYLQREERGRGSDISLKASFSNGSDFYNDGNVYTHSK